MGILCSDNRIYPARAILASGDCKRESGPEHSDVIQTVLTTLNAPQERLRLRVVSIASDGEARRGAAFIQLAFKQKLSPESPIYHHLHPLELMDLHVGDDDITCDKDWKHIFKRFRNLFLRPRGVVVNGFRITPDIIRTHLKSSGKTADHIRAIFNPDDQQDVKLAFDLLKDIWTLPTAPDNASNGFKRAGEALEFLGKLLYHLVFPFLCVDLSLSEQLEHLSAAAHLTIALYTRVTGGKAFIPTNLYLDVMHMIKNVFFCVAKAKVDDQEGSFWIILLGTDRLEEMFGILRTMVGTDANLDLFSLASRLSGCTEVSNILAKYPQWDRSPRRLKLPALTRTSTELPDRSDHIKPASWRGDVQVKNVSLQTSWWRGARLIERQCPLLVPIFKELWSNPSIDIFSPFGTNLVNTPLAHDDKDDTLDESETIQSSQEPIQPRSDTTPTNTLAEAEDALVADDTEFLHGLINPKVTINGKEVLKARALANFSKYRKFTSSTDRLKRVQQQARYAPKEISSSLSADSAGVTNQELEHVLAISDPVASFLCSDNRVWLCIGEVNSLRVDGQPVDYVSHSVLCENITTVSYQLLGLRPATMDDDSEKKHDWRSYSMHEHSFTVPGRLVRAVNPDISTKEMGKPFYLLDSNFLVALVASLSEFLSVLDFKGVPKLVPTNEFPYQEVSG